MSTTCSHRVKLFMEFDIPVDANSDGDPNEESLSNAEDFLDEQINHLIVEGLGGEIIEYERK